MNNDNNQVASAIKNLTLGDLFKLFGSSARQKGDSTYLHSKEELLKSKQVLNKDDIMQMLEVSENTAYMVIRSIKAYSDSLGVAGKILVSDYLAWNNRPRVCEDREL